MSKYEKEKLQRLASKFKALSNSNRLQILARMMGDCGRRTCRADDEALRRCVGELGSDLGLVPSTVSHHIKELRQAGLVHVERRGKTVECWIDADALGELAGFLTSTALGPPRSRTQVRARRG